jgi:hypothetical protein
MEFSPPGELAEGVAVGDRLSGSAMLANVALLLGSPPTYCGHRTSLRFTERLVSNFVSLIPASGSVGHMRSWRAKHWLAVALASFLVTVFAYFVGFAAPGLDLVEKCGLTGELYNVNPGSAKHRQGQQFFPLHAWCNGSYDLVPAWVNPAVAVFGILTVTAIACSMASAARRWATAD